MKIPENLQLTNVQRLMLGRDKLIYDESIEVLKGLHPCDDTVDYYVFCVEDILYRNGYKLTGNEDNNK